MSKFVKSAIEVGAKALPIALLMLSAGAGTARASDISILNACTAVTGVTGVTGGCGTGPYGTITLSPSGSNVNVTVALDPGFYFTDSTGAGKALYFDLSGNIPDTDIVNITSGFLLDGASGPTGHIANAFDSSTGAWEYAIECGDKLPGNNPCPGGAGGSTADATSFSFTIDNIALSNFIKNSDGLYFASSVYSSDPGTGETSANALTPSAVPEPGTITLLGMGLLGLARRRRMTR